MQTPLYTQYSGFSIQLRCMHKATFSLRQHGTFLFCWSFFARRAKNDQPDEFIFAIHQHTASWNQMLSYAASASAYPAKNCSVDSCDHSASAKSSACSFIKIIT